MTLKLPTLYTGVVTVQWHIFLPLTIEKAVC